jgi:hypothetical protein
MNIQASKTTKSYGYTLLEMSFAMVLLIGLGLSLLLMLNTHVEFMNWSRRQSFVARELPKISNLLGRLLNQADHFFIYENADDLTNPEAIPSLNGIAVKLFFNIPDGGVPKELHLVSLQNDTYRELRVLDGQDGSSWSLASGYSATASLDATGLQAADFSLEDGLLRVTLRGPVGEEVHFYGGTR